MFQLGETKPREVVEIDYACEYSLGSYLAAATAGQRVGVGTLHCEVPMTAEQYAARHPGSPLGDSQAFFLYEVDLVFIPGVGAWICKASTSPTATTPPCSPTSRVSFLRAPDPLQPTSTS